MLSLKGEEPGRSAKSQGRQPREQWRQDGQLTRVAKCTWPRSGCEWIRGVKDVNFAIIKTRSKKECKEELQLLLQVIFAKKSAIPKSATKSANIGANQSPHRRPLQSRELSWGSTKG